MLSEVLSHTRAVYGPNFLRLSLIFLRADKAICVRGGDVQIMPLVFQINCWGWLCIAPSHHSFIPHIFCEHPDCGGHKRDKEGSPLQESQDWTRRINTYKPVRKCYMQHTVVGWSRVGSTWEMIEVDCVGNWSPRSRPGENSREREHTQGFGLDWSWQLPWV